MMDSGDMLSVVYRDRSLKALCSISDQGPKTDRPVNFEQG